MGLSSDLISQFVKATSDPAEKKSESTTYGTVKKISDGTIYVQLDGAEDGQLTPASNTANVAAGERVTILVKNHSVMITGNVASPAARMVVDDDGNLTVEGIDKIVADNVAINKKLLANEAEFEEIRSANAAISGTLQANSAEIQQLAASSLTADVAKATYATIANLDVTNQFVNNLSGAYSEFKTSTVGDLAAKQAAINKLQTEKLDAESAKLIYANIDFSNIGFAAMEYLYAASGLIENVVVSEGSVTGILTGVTIKGDTIEGGTVIADKLVIQGEDGLYYKLNTDGVSTEAEQTNYNSLNGSIIAAKTITASKINVDDLAAFDATIGGFTITMAALYSGVKGSIDNSTRGVYMDHEGQWSVGDADNFIRYYKDDSGNWKLEIAAESILFGGDSKSSADDIKALTEHVKIGTYVDPDSSDSKPCVELSEGDSDFKQVITNTATMFMDGGNVRTKVDANGVTSENVTIGNELRQGGYVWKARSNGKYGLTWKGGNS